MAIEISGTVSGSPAAVFGIKPGTRLISVNGNRINDLLDYGFYTAEEELSLLVESGGETLEYRVYKDADEELGILADSFLMDRQHRCKNDCMFCFIDQLPPDLRESLYFKDDDERLSFLFGNYITLTNLSDEEAQRIVDMKISPVNVSVHTTNPELRNRMMGNRFAGEKLKYLELFAGAGTAMNCQIVLCRGVNDGDELRRTVEDLAALGDCVESIAVVPVGLTRYREGLAELQPFSRGDAAGVLDIIHAYQKRFREQRGCGLVYAADEWYLLAGRAVPGIETYDELSQLENGVGMMALTREEFECELRRADPFRAPVRCTLITGELAAPFITELAQQAQKKNVRLECRVAAVKNDFFGGNVSVSGLVTATDIARQVGGVIRGTALIPRNMLRAQGDLFLDSVSLEELSVRLGCEIAVIGDGAQLARYLMGAQD